MKDHLSSGHRTSHFSHELTIETRDWPAVTTLRLLAVLNVGSKNVGARQAVRALY